MRAGDVIKLSMFRGVDAGEAWAVAVDAYDIDFIEWLNASAYVRHRVEHGGPQRWPINESDPPEKWVVVPPEQWPAKVCVAMALRALEIKGAE